MRRPGVVWLVVICAFLVACGSDDPPALVPPLPDASDDDSGAAATDGGDLPDGGAGVGGSGGTGGGGPEDRCSDQLSGISCDVQDIASVTGGFCARFGSGDVKCWGATAYFVLLGIQLSYITLGDSADEFGDALDFFPLSSPAIGLKGDHELCAQLSENRVDCGDYYREFAPGGTRPITAIGTGETEAGLWFMFGTNEVLHATRQADGSVLREEVTFPFIPVAISSDLYQSRGTACAISTEGELWCWGDNAGGSLGLGDTEPRTLDETSPVPLGERVTSVVTARNTVCVTTESGALKCWGKSLRAIAMNDQSGMHDIGGHPNDIETLGPLSFGPGRKVTQISMGDYDVSVTMCALLDNGNVHCWGYNAAGEAGIGEPGTWVEQYSLTQGGLVPRVNLGNGRRALQIAGTIHNNCALLDDHSVKCWGGDGWGVLGTPGLGALGDGPNEMGNNLPRIDFGTQTRAQAEGEPPIVTVTSPLQVTDPGPDDVVMDTLHVICEVEASETGDPIDDSSVTIRIGSVGSASIETQAIATTEGSYAGTLTGISALPTGEYEVTCSASDQAAEPRIGRGSVVVIHDGGPNVRLISPEPDAVVGQSMPVTFEVEVAPATLWAGDDEADVVSASLTIAGVDFALQPATEPNHFTARVNWLSPAFTSAPSGDTQVILEATNVRGATAIVNANVHVDGTGPVIVVTSGHENGTLVRGAEVMFLTVTDAAAGVDPSSVIGNIGMDDFSFKSQSGDSYRGVFDTLQFDRTFSQLVVTIRASDLVGNVTIITRSLQLDNQPPLISLDPPPIREVKQVPPNRNICSGAFDPVGSDSLSDGSVAPEGAELRARMDDRTNGLQSLGVVTYLSLIDRQSARVYMSGDLDKPILVDTNDDGVCDEINNELSPAMRRLSAITPTGASDYPASAEIDGLQPAWGNGCEAGTETTPHAPLCGSTSPLTRVIRGRVLGQAEPTIYGLSPVNSGVTCVGDAWDWRLEFPEGGPVCVVARAEDHLGNVGVSRPLRVCLQRSDNQGFDCLGDLSWRNHDCLAGEHDNEQVSCTAPEDYALGYAYETDPQ